MKMNSQDIILFVDDESRVLEGIQRQLKGKFCVQTALGAERALSLVQESGPFALVVSDMQMPGMNGMEFLSRLRYSAPDTVRVMLTGNADMQTAIDAVNDGHLFRFLTKPCSPHELAQCLEAGLEYYRFLRTEQEFSKHNIEGCITLLLKLLAFTKPESYKRSLRVCDYVKQISEAMGMRDVAELETAAQLSQIGSLIHPSQCSDEPGSSKDMNIDEILEQAIDSVAGWTLLRHIPSLLEIAKAISYQEKHFDGSGCPKDWRSGTDIPLGARILKVALDFDSLLLSGMQKSQALHELGRRNGWYDPVILASFQQANLLSQGSPKMSGAYPWDPSPSTNFPTTYDIENLRTQFASS